MKRIALSILAAGVAHAGIFDGSTQTITLDASAFLTADPSTILDSSHVVYQGGDTDWNKLGVTSVIQSDPLTFGAAAQGTIDSKFTFGDYTATGVFYNLGTAEAPASIATKSNITTAIHVHADNLLFYSWNANTSKFIYDNFDPSGYATIKLEAVGGGTVFEKSFYGGASLNEVGSLNPGDYIFTMSSGIDTGAFRYGQTLYATVVPEPGETAAAVGLLCLVGGWVVRRRR